MDEGHILGLRAEGTAIFEANPDWHEASDRDYGLVGADYRKWTTPREGQDGGPMGPGETTAWGEVVCVCVRAGKSRFKDRSKFNDRVW